MDPLQTCPRPEELAAYRAGDLALPTREAVARHVQGCPDCRVRLADLLGTSEAVPPRDHDGTDDTAAEVPSPVGRSSAVDVGEGTARRAQLPDPLLAIGWLREYQPLSTLGGGMGTVYRALHTRLDKVVALKVLPAQRKQSAAAVARFLREMKAVGKLDHPNIVRATDAGEVDGTHFLVMELIEGADLGRLVGGHGRLAVSDACELIRQAAVGLAHAHARGLIHRDVKPSNLMVTPAGLVKVLDLGLALFQGAATVGERTANGVLLGSIDYLAPEQGDDPHNVDARADLYSLGCTLYHLLIGHPPFFRSPSATPLQRIKAHALAPIPRVRDDRPEVPGALAAVVECLLAKKPRRPVRRRRRGRQRPGAVRRGIGPARPRGRLPWTAAGRGPRERPRRSLPAAT
jgi:serine/threonine protein kinase